MKRFGNLETWLHGLFGGVIGGAASAGLSWIGMVAAKSAGVDVPALNLKALGVILLTSGLAAGLAYLKQSPLPPLEETQWPRPVPVQIQQPINQYEVDTHK